MFGKKDKPDETEYFSNRPVTMPNPAILVACVEEVAPAKNVEGLDPLALDALICSIRQTLEPAVQVSDKDGLYIENEKYSVTLMKSGLIKIFEKTDK